MLTAYFDGSGTGSSTGRYVIAGYVAFARQWEEEFIEAWDAELKRNPPIPYFRMASLRNAEWRGQHGLSDLHKESKVKKLSKLLNSKLLSAPPQIQASIVCSVAEEDFIEVVKSDVALRQDKLIVSVVGDLCFKTHYTYLFHSAIARTLWKVRDIGICGDVVDFVFDREEKQFDNAKRLLDGMRPILPPEIRDMLGDAVHADDTRLNPLQAADLLAATARDYYRDPRRSTERALLCVSGIGERNASIIHTKDHLRSMVAGLKGKEPVNTTVTRPG